jgi:hypothetical protein
VDSFLQEYNRSMLQILTIHEAYPGHYVQLAWSNRHPSLIRKVLSSGTFAEGWAVYTEAMMLDQGFGRGDLALRLHQLKFYLRAVVNAILDHEMHAGGMTDDQAMALLVDRAFQTEGRPSARSSGRSNRRPSSRRTLFFFIFFFYLFVRPGPRAFHSVPPPRQDFSPLTSTTGDCFPVAQSRAPREGFRQPGTANPRGPPVCLLTSQPLRFLALAPHPEDPARRVRRTATGLREMKLSKRLFVNAAWAGG